MTTYFKCRRREIVSTTLLILKPKLRRIKVQQKRNLLEKLSSFDHTRPLKRAQKQRIGLTGEWLSKTREFQDWISDTTSSLLLLSGKRKRYAEAL